MTDQKPPTTPPTPLLSQEEMQAIIEATVSARLLDRFGRPILPGCDIELHSELPPVYTVIDARPNLQAPRAGAWLLTVCTQISVQCQQGQRHQKMTVVAFPEMPQAAPQPGGTARSDAPAGPQGSIVLTDMDKVARETLGEIKTTETARKQDEGASLKLVPQIDHGGEQ